MMRAGSKLRVALLVLAAGLLIAASMPPLGWWALAPVGIAVLDRLLDGRPPASRFWRTYFALVTVFLPTWFWMQYLTLPGWLIASAFYPLLFGAGAALLPPGRAGRWIALPGMWVLVDALRGRWPFGGVPLSTLALSEVAGPLAAIARVGGALLLTGITVVAGVGLAAATRRAWRAVGIATVVVVALVGWAAVAPRGHDLSALRIAVVQGGGPTGHRDVEEDDARVFQAHLAASKLIRQPVDLVVWPEDVVDVDGDVENTPEGHELSALAERLDVPVIAGTVESYGSKFRNSAVVFLPDGTIGDRYTKVRRVPFGEYTPLRSLLERIERSALVPNEAFPGQDPATLDTPAGRMGVAISWEVFFSDRTRNAIGNGGSVLLNPTNGATFRGTQVQAQQLAASKLRAIETGRWVVQAAPTGYSALVTPDGRVVTRTDIGDQTVLQQTIQRRSGQTIATRVGDWLALGAALAAIACGWAVDRRQRARSTNVNDGRRSTAAPASTPDGNQAESVSADGMASTTT
jgi:apolipoprotein N-acyltransferase